MDDQTTKQLADMMTIAGRHDVSFYKQKITMYKNVQRILELSIGVYLTSLKVSTPAWSSFSSGKTFVSVLQNVSENDSKYL